MPSILLETTLAHTAVVNAPSAMVLAVSALVWNTPIMSNN